MHAVWNAPMPYFPLCENRRTKQPLRPAGRLSDGQLGIRHCWPGRRLHRDGSFGDRMVVSLPLIARSSKSTLLSRRSYGYIVNSGASHWWSWSQMLSYTGHHNQLSKSKRIIWKDFGRGPLNTHIQDIEWTPYCCREEWTSSTVWQLFNRLFLMNPRPICLNCLSILTLECIHGDISTDIT